MRASLILVGAMGFVLALGTPLRGQDAPSRPSPAAAPQGEAASEGKALDRLVSLDLQDVPLGDALKEINRQAQLGLAYSAKLVPVDRRVTIRAAKITAGQALERVLEGTGMRAEEAPGGTVLLVKDKRKVEASAEQGGAGAIGGYVKDSAGVLPLKGAQVSVEHTSLTAFTNDSGLYWIKGVPAGPQTVSARLIGYAPAVQAVTVVDSQIVRVDFRMAAKPTRLAEVVTTATGSRRRVELGNDITVLNADSIVATQPVTSVTDLLDGRVPGLVVQRSSGAPGDPARLRLRGTSSAHLSNDPIVIVDGVRVYAAQSDTRSRNLASQGFATPSPLDYLDPSSIETIEVFKGPSAATLYGADAANGVIVITTKKGGPGSQWTASVEHGTTGMAGAYPDSYLRWGRVPWTDTPVVCPLLSDFTCTADSLVRFQTLNDPELTILDRGHRTATNVGVSGGSDAMTYNVTANFRDELGLVRLPELEIERYRSLHASEPPDWMRRPQELMQWGVSSRLSARLGAKADVALTALLSRSEQRRSSLEGQIANLMMTYVDRGTGTYYRPVNGGTPAPVDELLTQYYERVTADATEFTNAVNVNWRPWSWLTTSADAGLNVVQRDDGSFIPPGVSSTVATGQVGAGRGSSFVSTANAGATITAPLAVGLRLQASVGANYTSERTSDVSVLGRNLAPGATTIGRAGEILAVTSGNERRETFGAYLEPRLVHKRFWLSTGLRFDGGSTFGSRTKLAAFPKVNASYLISDEPFFPFRGVFDALRLRAAYGHAGVQPGPGDRLRLYSTPTLEWIDGGFAEAVLLQELGNTELKPERSRELEVGLDADLFNRRLSLSVTVYDKTRVDALMYVPLPPSVHGGGTVLKNVGTIRNRGAEVTVTGQMLRSDAVTWGTQLSLAQNRNKVVELGPGVEPFGNNSARVVAGYPLFGRWGLPVLGYQDRNGDGVLEAGEVLYGDSLAYLGSSEPDYTASLHTTLSLFRGAVAVTAMFTYQGGFAQQGPFSSMFGVLRASNDPTAPLAEQAAVVSSGTSDFLNTQTVSMLRFDALSVGYTVPASVARRFGARTLTVSLQGTNLGLRTNYRGIDPGVNSLTVGDGLMDAGALPRPRTWQVRVNATY